MPAVLLSIMMAIIIDHVENFLQTILVKRLIFLCLLKRNQTFADYFRYKTSKLSDMKKIIRVSLVFVLLAGLFASCKSHEKCPAYGQMNKTKRHSEIRG